MQLRIFALYDIKSGAHGTPFFMHHVGEAVRACIDLGQDANTTVGRHPADFALHEIGSFDASTGLIVGQQPVSHGSVVSFLPRPQATFFDPIEGRDRTEPVRVVRNGVSTNGMDPHASSVEA